MLGAGVFVWAAYGYVSFRLVGDLRLPDTGTDEVRFYIWLVLFAMMWPKCLVGFALGTWLVAWAIKDWHGNVNRMLLLRLLDAQQPAKVTSEKNA
jgi:hypothetical protein